MLKRCVLVTALALIPSLPACDGGLLPGNGGVLVDEDGFRVVRSVPAALTLINDTPERVYYFVADREALALIDWVPCIDPHRCFGINPGERVRLGYAQIAGYQPGSGSAVVYWWLMVPEASGRHRPDRIRSVDIEL